jgi:hypothetical protein
MFGVAAGRSDKKESERSVWRNAEGSEVLLEGQCSPWVVRNVLCASAGRRLLALRVHFHNCGSTSFLHTTPTSAWMLNARGVGAHSYFSRWEEPSRD